MGNAQAHHFELPEGAAAQLDRQQVAEILFLAHMGEPIESPFFAPLGNRFAYLSHDDGWYGKLYCRDMGEFMSVLWKKLTGKANTPTPVKMQNELLSMAQKGLAIDMEETRCSLPGIYRWRVHRYGRIDEPLAGD